MTRKKQKKKKRSEKCNKWTRDVRRDRAIKVNWVVFFILISYLVFIMPGQMLLFAFREINSLTNGLTNVTLPFFPFNFFPFSQLPAFFSRSVSMLTCRKSWTFFAFSLFLGGCSFNLWWLQTNSLKTTEKKNGKKSTVCCPFHTRNVKSR